MNFTFNIHLSDEDYLDYNIFWNVKSPYGRKQIMPFRILGTLLAGAFCFLSLFRGGFSAEAFIGILPIIILLVLFQLFFKPFLILSLKVQMKSLKKQGKMGYSPIAQMEFYEDRFIETTTDQKIEQKYFAVERVSVIVDKIIYIHVNSVNAYMLPFSCFESKMQQENFLAFIKTKCTKIDVYS